MCGLIAWTARPPDAVMLVSATGRRGPHAHGWATPAADGWLVEGGYGPLAGSPHGLAVGHSRMATSGDRPGDRPGDGEYQPIARDTQVLAHNGVLPDEDQHRIDSLALMDLWGVVDPHDHLFRIGGHHALITVDLATRQLVASSTGQPLWAREHGGQVVLTSYPVDTRRWRPVSSPDCWEIAP